MSGNVAGAAAADATLELIETQPILETIAECGTTLMNGVGQILIDANIPHAMLGHPAIFGIILGVDEAPTDFRGYLNGDAAIAKKVQQACLAEKLLLLTCGTDGQIIRWIPPLTVNASQIDDALSIFDKALESATP